MDRRFTRSCMIRREISSGLPAELISGTMASSRASRGTPSRHTRFSRGTHCRRTACTTRHNRGTMFCLAQRPGTRCAWSSCSSTRPNSAAWTRRADRFRSLTVDCLTRRTRCRRVEASLRSRIQTQCYPLHRLFVVISVLRTPFISERRQ